MSESNELKQRKNLLLVNKKKQKNFVNLKGGCKFSEFCIPNLLNKSFLLFFFKK